MSNVRRPLPGHIPAAFARDGQEVPPSTDVAEANLANVIGEAVALHLANVLGPMLQQMPWHPACVLCVQARKQAEQAEGEEPPGIAQAVTWMPLGQPGQPPNVLPVCYGHFQTGPAVRPTGLVAPSGQPIVARS